MDVVRIFNKFITVWNLRYVFVMGSNYNPLCDLMGGDTYYTMKYEDMQESCNKKNKKQKNDNTYHRYLLV